VSGAIDARQHAGTVDAAEELDHRDGEAVIRLHAPGDGHIDVARARNRRSARPARVDARSFSIFQSRVLWAASMQNDGIRS
jgi:hypothetical protein